MSMTVNLTGPAPWGFRITGGRDFRKPIIVSKVTEHGKAAAGDLRPGDIIVSINGDSTADMLNVEAQNKIKQSSGRLQLEVDRSQLFSPGQTNGESSPEMLAMRFQDVVRTRDDSQGSVRSSYSSPASLSPRPGSPFSSSSPGYRPGSPYSPQRPSLPSEGRGETVACSRSFQSLASSPSVFEDRSPSPHGHQRPGSRQLCPPAPSSLHVPVLPQRDSPGGARALASMLPHLSRPLEAVRWALLLRQPDPTSVPAGSSAPGWGCLPVSTWRLRGNGSGLGRQNQFGEMLLLSRGHARQGRWQGRLPPQRHVLGPGSLCSSLEEPLAPLPLGGGLFSLCSKPSLVAEYCLPQCPLPSPGCVLCADSQATLAPQLQVQGVQGWGAAAQYLSHEPSTEPGSKGLHPPAALGRWAPFPAPHHWAPCTAFPIPEVPGQCGPGRLQCKPPVDFLAKPTPGVRCWEACDPPGGLAPGLSHILHPVASPVPWGACSVHYGGIVPRATS
ncbi:PDZ and LIM domain protein 2 isoform X1 [Chrysemys picta bellii]|uniref:PDZ and LIM domain 2 n=1 Tax=Chrysemys picta bellii TaxID=8478 RepID=A0A8C3H5W3_CHRPI